MKKRKTYADSDFTSEMLPKNRFYEFFDILKLQHNKLLAWGLFLFLFCLPLLVINILQDFYSASGYYLVEQGKMTQADGSEFIRAVSLYGDLILIPCWGILGLGLAGLDRILLHLSFEDPVFFFEDFKTGIKKNGKVYVLSFLVMSILYAVDDFVRMYPSPNLFFNALPFGFTAFFFWMPFVYFLGMEQVYQMKFSEKLKNSYILYFQNGGYSLLALIALCSPYLFMLVNNLTWKWILLSCFLIFLAPYLFLGIRLEENSVFDSSINEKYYGEIYRRGLRK